MPTPFDDKTIMNWFFAYLDSAPCKENLVSTIGSFPILEVDFDDLLRLGGITPNYITKDTDVLIVGREEWIEEDLSKLLDMREGKTLKVYSQEMFMSYWGCGQDPFENQEILEVFREEHPALEFLSNTRFDWPSMNVSLGRGGEFTGELVKVGPLRLMGYKVGERGLALAKRQAILKKVFKFRLPDFELPDWYIEVWASPNSRERLRKMANSLAAFYRRERKLNHRTAASDYEADLEWLHETFYSRRRFRFRWPQTYV